MAVECAIMSQGHMLLVLSVALDKSLPVSQPQFAHVRSEEAFLFMNGEAK